jgi:hypothetical protein
VRRIERELKALHALEARHRLRDIVWAVATIAGLAALCLAALVKLHWMSGSILLAGALLAGAASVALGAAIWLIGRAWFVLAFLIVCGLLILVFEDLPDRWDWPSGKDSKNKKTDRRTKLQAAIAKREALVQRLGHVSL